MHRTEIAKDVVVLLLHSLWNENAEECRAGELWNSGMWGEGVAMPIGHTFMMTPKVSPPPPPKKKIHYRKHRWGRTVEDGTGQPGIHRDFFVGIRKCSNVNTTNFRSTPIFPMWYSTVWMLDSFDPMTQLSPFTHNTRSMEIDQGLAALFSQTCSEWDYTS